MPELDREERHRRLVLACAIAHGVGTKMSTAEMVEMILERGLPSREEREHILRERRGDNTTAAPFRS